MLVAFLFLGGIAKSENLQNVLQNLERLEKDIQDLQKEIYREKDSKNISTINSSEGIDRNLAAFDIRISDIENEVRQLTTYVEEYVFRIDELSDKIDDVLLEQRSNIILSENNSTGSLEENRNDQSVDESQDSFNDNEEQTLGSLIISGDEAIEEKVGESFGDDILPDGSPEEQYQFAFSLLRSQKFDEAKRAFEIFIDKQTIRESLLSMPILDWATGILSNGANFISKFILVIIITLFLLLGKPPKNTSKEWNDNIAVAMAVLTEESKLQEIVQLVGSDALPEDQQLTLEVARMLREFYLQQNAFHDVDTYCEIKDQAKFLEVVLHYKDLAEKSISSCIDLEDVLGLSILEDIGRSKFEENMADLLDKYDKKMTKEFSKIMEGT